MSEQKQMRESPSASLLMDLRTSSDSQGVPSPLLALSTAPTKQQIDEFKDVPISDLPKTYFRPPQDRVYVNRDLRMDKINFIGFDMDFTLAVYKESHDVLTFDLALLELVKLGYPAELKSLNFDGSYPIRGLMLDIDLGNYLKVDMFGHISKCYHGSRRVPKKELAELYPSVMIDTNDRNRFYSLDTLYSVCEAGLFRQMVDFLDGAALDVSYENLFQDVRSTIDRIHRNGLLKGPIMADPAKYIHKAPQLRPLLERVRKSGMKAFVLTNSDYLYSNVVMNYLLPADEGHGDWKQCFDYIIVAACKPAFFKDGSQLREVDLETGNLQIGKQPEQLERGRVYNGGSIKLFQELTGAIGNQVLYVGDHIFSDVVVSKQRHFWRTLLVVRELEHEISADQNSKEIKLHLRNLEFIRREAHRGLDSTATEPPNLKELRKEIAASHEMLDKQFNAYWGSLFRSGTKHSLFSLQVRRFADLYASHFGNLCNYPLFYLFSSASENLPHEDLA